MRLKRGICFTKMQGAGNDYIYIDSLGGPESEKLTDLDLPDLARKISDRHFGIGSDGLIVISPSDNADFRMRMFNADGSEAEMCGNGIRCVGKYVWDKGFTEKTVLRIETKAGIKELFLHVNGGEVDKVTVDMGNPIFESALIPVNAETNKIPVKIDNIYYELFPVSMGNPHGVIFLNGITDKDVLENGPKLETNPIWPDKANIEFVEIKDRNHISMRVWERGSGETFACGTGACASVVIACHEDLTDNKVTVTLKGGILEIEYDRKNEKVYLTGDAVEICSGEYYLKK